MEAKNKKSQSSSSLAKVWTSLVMTTLGVIASLISAMVGTADFLKVSREWILMIAAAIAAVAVSAGLTSILVRRERGSLRIAKLKDDTAAAYLDALDNSVLNPLRRDQQ